MRSPGADVGKEIRFVLFSVAALIFGGLATAQEHAEQTAVTYAREQF